MENEGIDCGVDAEENEIELEEKLDFERMYKGLEEKLAFNLSTSV